MATINSENAKQIRDPMEIYIHLFAGSSATIGNYTAYSPYKSYDSTLGNTSWSMRSIADLAGDGFPLDGSVEWFDSSITPSANNGKLGVRGVAGSNVQIGITASGTLTSITVASQNVGTITVGGVSYPSTGLNVIPINATSATLQFSPSDSDERVMVDYIIPGAEFSITNDNLVSCNLSLRSDLSVQNHTWEESEIEISMYYPYDISSTFAYIQSDFPITYQAGYDSDLSEIRRFYLSEPITEENNVVTIRGVDASHWLDNKMMNEQWITTNTGNSREAIYNKFVQAIQAAGIKLVHKQNVSRANSGTTQYAVLPEMSTRDFVSEVMNLTLSYRRSGIYYGIQFVDAGIPSVEFGDGKTFGNTWTINKSDCADWVESYEQNIARIQETNDERKYNESISIASEFDELGGDTSALNIYDIEEQKPGTLYKTNQLIELDFDGYYAKVGNFHDTTTTISITPSRAVFKATKTSEWSTKKFTFFDVHYVKNGKCIVGAPAIITGGVSSYSNPNNLPGITIDYDPFIYGILTDANGATVFNYPSLFNRSLRTGSFTFKGDPRQQPLDYLNLVDDTKSPTTTITARITSIELAHEGGGTTAVIGWREWS